MAEEKKELDFEQALKKLEAIVDHLENGDLSLEAALKQYEEGMKLAEICTRRLTDAEKKVEVLMKINPGRFKTTPLEDAGENPKPKKKK